MPIPRQVTARTVTPLFFKAVRNPKRRSWKSIKGLDARNIGHVPVSKLTPGASPPDPRHVRSRGPRTPLRGRGSLADARSHAETTGPETHMLEARGLTKYYSAITGVRDVNFQIAPGTVLGLLGPNGSGKSTTVGMLTG